ncbi:MAG: thioredoxin-disulfide reductase [Deltaproteobacteria bacterium]|jgi:thioredoxin reductase (NADPH)|nr:thioredoxin-disulfide reductase [Deltaproteobacteria bacterium]
MSTHDLIIIGAGPAGLTAAVYARRSGLNALVLEMGLPGGQMRLSGDIENWPGTELISGEDLSEKMRAQAASFGALFQDAEVESVEASSDGLKEVKTTAGDFKAKAVLVATGAYHKHLDDAIHDKYYGRGLSYCAVCDGGFFRGQDVAVVGGGNTALESAMFLTNHAKKIYLIHRRDKFRADQVVIDRLSAHPKIELVMDHVVDGVKGQDEVEAVVLKHAKTGELKEIPVTGLFLFVGTAPHSGFLPQEVERIDGGWVKTDRHLQTTMPGLFAAGDVRDTDLRQIVTAAADGALAAMCIYRYIEGTLGVM